MFISLHNHSHYSLLDGLPKINDYVNKALEYKMPALGLTDHGTMYGIIEFYQKCKDKGIKPILGCEMYVAPRQLHLKHHGKDNKPYHLILLAKNNQGYKNLMHLTTVAHLDGFYYKPRIDKETLKKYSDGLIATSACMAGEVSRALAQNNLDWAIKAVKEYQDIFNKENFYLELGYIGNSLEQTEINTKIIQLAKKTKAPLVASRDTHYINSDDKIAQDTLVCVATGRLLKDEKRLNMTGFDLDFIHPRLMEEYFKDIAPEAIKNTEKIANECNVNLDLGEWYFPKYELPNNLTAEDELKRIAREGLIKKIPDITEKIKERLEYELDTICKKGYASYFLIVSDLIKFAKKNKIPTTTRGSAAGSLVGYAIEIIPINPLYFELPFERFLNPYRISAPDIDMDFADNRREEVLNYAREKYGYNKVANICTFGTMAARGSVRDVTRVLDFPYEFGDKLSKLIPFGLQGFPMTIERAINETQELKNIYNSDPNAKKILDLAQKIEGCARHLSVHAAGVVISPTILTDFTPLQKDPTGQRGIITQYEMKSCEATGLIKFDFLGIRNLSILGDAVKIIEKTKEIKIDLNNLPLNDEKTFKFISSGFTFGVFQLGGSGMTKWLMQLKPSKIKELAAMIALFRPGPMESIPEFIARKHGKKSIKYLDPALESILKDTYGVITYQDDILLIAIKVAGYTWETVDKFRKAIGKKIPELMAEQEKNLVEGCQKHSGWTEEKAEELWKLFDPFKGYGFGRAHAASYADIAYQTAYLKTYYTAEFMTALMTAESQDTDKIVEAVNECKKLGIKVLPPDVNHSRPDFTYISDSEIRFGLLAIKNLGADIANLIVSNHKEKGEFKSLEDFLKRIETRNLNRKSLDALIRAGALDSLGERGQMLDNLDRLLDFVRSKQREKNTGQKSLFSNLNNGTEKKPELFLKETDPANLKTKLIWEKELLGLYVSGHPFSEMDELVNPHVTCRCVEIFENSQKNERVILAGVISKIQRIITKKNEPMAFLTLTDISADIEIIVFPRTLSQLQENLQEDLHIMLSGKISKKDDRPKIILDKFQQITPDNISQVVQNLNEQITNSSKQYYSKGKYNGFNNTNDNSSVSSSNTQISKIWINLPKFFNSEIHQQLKNVFNLFPGQTVVCLLIEQNGAKRRIETEFKVSYSPEIRSQLEKIIGNGNIKVEYK